MQAPFTADAQEAFWTFSNFRDKVEARGPVAVDRAKAEATRLEHSAVNLQRALEEAARGQYETNKPAAVRLLETYSRGVYSSAIEVMDAILSDK